MSRLLSGLRFAAAICGASSATAATIPASNTLSRPEVLESRGLTDPLAHVLVSDAQGRPQALLLDVSALAPGQTGLADLVRVSYDGYTWQREVLLKLQTQGVTPTGSELAARLQPADGSLHVLVLENRGPGTADDRLRYLRRGGPAAALDEVIATGAIAEVELAVDAVGDVYAAWLQSPQNGRGQLRAARRVGEVWSGIAVDTAVAAHAPTLVSHGNASGAMLGWIENASTSVASMRALGSSGPAGPVQTLLSSDPATAVLDLELAAGPSPQLEMLVLRQTGASSVALQHFRRDGQQWLCFDNAVNCRFASFNQPHVLPRHAFSLAGDTRAVSVNGPEARLLRRISGNTVWSSEFVDGELLGSTAIDAAHLPMMLSAGPPDDSHRDLRLIRVVPRWSSRRVPNDSNVLVRAALSLTQDLRGNPLAIASVNTSGDGEERLFRWSGSGFGDLLSEALPSGFRATAASVLQGPDQRIHVAMHDALSADLVYAVRSINGEWMVERPATAGSTGHSPTMLLSATGLPVIVYQDASPQITVAVRGASGWLFAAMSDGPVAAGQASRPRAVIGPDGFLVHASYFDGSALRVATRAGDFSLGASTLRSEVVASGLGNVVSGEVHAIALLADGGWATAFSARSPSTGNTRLVYRAQSSAGANVGQQYGPTATNGPITRIELATGQYAAREPRILWQQQISAGNPAQRLQYGHNALEGFELDDFGLVDMSNLAAPLLGLDASSRVTLAWAENSGLTLARRRPQLGFPADSDVTSDALGAGPSLPPFAVSPICYCLLQVFLFGGPNAAACPVSPPTPQRGPADPAADLLPRLRQHFAGTEGGRHYLDLWTNHATEITALTLQRPALLSQRFRTWHDLQPGLTALVNGEGANFYFNADLIASTRAVWQGWIDQGSPELALAVQTELDRLNQFEDFHGMSFAQWFASLQPAGAVDRLFGDGFEP